MADKKSWRDYLENDSEEKSNEKAASGTKTGGWRDYAQSYSSANSVTSNTSGGGWRQYSTYDPVKVWGDDFVNRVNNWLTDHSAYIKDQQNRYSGRKYSYEDAYVGDSADWLKTSTERHKALETEADSILADLDQYGGYFDEKWVTKVRGVLANAKADQRTLLRYAEEDNKWWGNFGSEELVNQYGSAEEAYKYYQRSDGYSKKYTGMTADELYNIAGNLDDGEEKDWLSSYASSVDYDEKSKADLTAVEKEIEELEDFYNEAYGVEAWYNMYRVNPGAWKQEDIDKNMPLYNTLKEKYGSLEGLEKRFAEKQQYLDSAKKIQEYARLSQVGDSSSEMYDPEFNKYTGYTKGGELPRKPDYKDIVYGIVNGDVDAKGGYISAEAYEKISLQERSRLNAIPYMSDEEKALYNYYYNKYGYDAAEEFLDGAMFQLEARKNQVFATAAAQLADENPWLASSLSVVTSLGSGFEYLYDSFHHLTGEFDEIDTNESAMVTNAIRGAVSEKVDWEIGNWDAFDFVYNTAMSGADSLASTAFGGFGGSVLGLSAAAQGTNDALNRGMSNDKAFWNGLFSGAFEGIFETVSLGQFKALKDVPLKVGLKNLDKTVITDIFKNLGKTMLVNASEEMATEIANIAYDTLVNGEFANYTLEELENGAWKEVLAQVVESGASGALMGLGFGAIGNASAHHQGVQNANEYAFKQYGNNTGALIQEGLESDTKSDSYKLATKYQKQVDSSTAMTGKQIRNLLAANQEQITPKDLQKIQQAAEKRLTELGQTEDVSKLAALATKYATGQKLSKAEKNFLASSKYGSRVYNELLPKNIASENYSTGWVEGIGTKQVNAAAYNKKTIRTLLDAMAQAEDPNAYKSIEERAGTESGFGVSKSGESIVRESGKAIDLSKAEIVSIGDGDMTIKVDGKEVKASEVDFADGDQSYLFEAVSKIENITPAAATAIIRDYDASSGQTVGAYLNGIDEGYTYGYHGYTEADLQAGNFTPKLTKEQMMSAYRLGQSARKISDDSKADTYKKMRTAAQAQAEKAVAEGKKAQKAKNLTITYNQGGGKVVSIDEAGITDAKQSGAVKVAEILHKMGLGTRVEFFSSYLSETMTDKKGKPARVFVNDNGVEQRAYSGVYRKKDGTIRVDLNAYNGRGLTLNALAHELTHFIQQWSDRKYKVLVDFLMQEYEKTDMTMRERVLKEQARLEEIRGEAVSYDEAYDEVVANAMSKMFDDGKLVEKLAELKAKDKNLAQKLWEGFKKILAKFIGIYEKEGALFKDAADIVAMKETFEQLQAMFAEALVEASENYQASLTVSESQTLTEAGIGFDEDTKSVYSLHFSTAYKDEIQVGKQTFDTEAIAQIVAKGTSRSIEDARKWVQSELTIANIVMQNSEFLDFEADNRYEAIKKNSDYPQGTVDLSNLCPKREEFTTMFDMLQKKYPNKLFTAQDVAEMRKILSDNDITVACGACFVEDRRQLLGEIADTYINMWKEAVESGKPLQKINAAGVKSDLLVTKALAKQYGITAGTKIMATDTYIPTQYDLTTYEGFKLLEKNHPTIAMGFNRYNNSRGQQSARLIEGRAEYNRQILGWSDAKVRSVNNNGGLRIFSFSDFEVVHLLDLVQVIIDCAAKGVKIQGYTKIPAFAKLVRGTGIKLNRSLIPKGDYGYHMENGKVVLDYDTTEGIDIHDENFIDESDNPDVGNIVIGVNPTQIGAAMLDPFIDYVIPFHSNKAKEILKRLGTGEWVNYKESQHEKDISTGKASKHNVNIYTEVINKYHPKNKVEFVEAFLKECKRQGKTPRYAEFLNVDANGDYAYREGYHKLLVDFKMFDADGNILPQGYITPNLEESFMKSLLNAEIDKKQSYEFPQAVYDAIDKKFGENSLDNSSVNTENNLTEKQVRGEVNDNRRIREVSSGDARSTAANWERKSFANDGGNHSENTGDAQKVPSWGDIDTAVRKRVKRAVNSHIKNSKNSGEIYYYLVDLTGRSERDITPESYRKAVNRLTEDLFNSAMSEHTVIFENRWKFMGETSKLHRAILEAAQEDAKDGEQYSSQEVDLDSDGNQLSKEQQEFFKDSVVRDAEGNLLVVYHGTPNGSTTIFDKAKTSKINDMGQGMYFSTNKGDASSYTGKSRNKKLYSTYVNIKAPFVVSDNVKITVSEAASLLKLCDDRTVALDVYRGDVLRNAKDGYITTSQLANTNISQHMTEMLEKSGKYDGIIDETVSVKFGLEEGTKHIIALNSNQIKSIDNQNPTTNPDIRYSSQETDLDSKAHPYSYKTLVSKPDMVVTTVSANVPKNRADVVYQAKQNAAKVGKFDPKTGSVSVYVDDVGAEVVLATNGLKHSLDRRFGVNAPVVLRAGEILHNSIRINEMTPKKEDASESYILIGTARNENGDMYIVRSVINRFSNELASMDVLYAINAKKEPAALLPRLTENSAIRTDSSGNRPSAMLPGFQGPVTDSTISIAELLDLVNQYFPDILPEDVLKHYGYDARPDGDLGKDALYSEHDTDYSNRDLLANAFEGLSQSSVEYKMIQEYKEQIKVLNLLEDQLRDLNAEIREIRFTKGKYDAQRLQKIEEKAERIAKDINKQDKVLLNMEASEPLRKVIEYERKKAAQKTKEHIAEIQQNKKVRAEQAELRHKIRKAVRDLDKLLNRGNKKTNVKEDMKGFVSKALELADYLFTDHISNDELIRRGIDKKLMRGNEAQLVKETEDILSQLYDNADNLTDEEFTKLDAKRKRNMEKLRDLLTAQRNERLNTPVYNLFNDLVTEYAALKNSNQEAVKAAYDAEVERFLRSYIGESNGETDSNRKTLLQNMRVADMTMDELWRLYNAYSMVLHSVRNANKLFVQGKAQSLEEVANKITRDFSKRKAPDGKVATVARNLANKIGWDYEKLYYALDRIGSEAFTELVMNIANSENIVMQDIIEAAAFRDEIVNKYGFNNWDVNKKIGREFLDNTGKKFKLTLGQMMALYAYSRREGAWDHIEYGGFVFGDRELTNPKPADSYKLTKAQCEAITNLLTKEQKGYVEAMQKYLSETMGGKGNEVSMLLYGIKMFNEKNYFPIHIAGQFKAQANESQAKAAAGFSSMTNAGFTHAQNPNAKAPFVLEGFNEVWADHVNEMSRYHGTVPALEDMRRVMNRSSYSESTAESIAIKQLMENSFGKEAVDYFDNLYKEANSGAITDKLQQNSKKLLSLFRKNSVAYSLSVLVQQPASIVRAYALVDRKYFGFKGVGVISSGVAKAVTSKWNNAYANAYNEMMKYAPGVTMAKEIGGFDTATGGSIRSYLLDTNKSLSQKWKTGTIAEKGKAVLGVVDDNAIANLPNVADKIAWIEIWNACKRETVAKHKDLATNSEEFMQAVGERFTEVIRATQVYDSIFAKSPRLKSKNLFVQMLVSFMNEPNTVANMAEKALRDATKGDWKSGAKTAAVVVHSVVFTNVLKSLIYAMRDDDEDETYIEKYIEAVTGNMMNDLNALNYIPIARDVLSLAQGYDVERADMAIVADAIDALNSVIKNATTDTEDMTEEQLAEFDKKCTEANWKLVESLASFFGIPVKNIRREIDGVLDHAKIASANAGKTTALSAWDKVYDSVIESIPFLQTKRTKGDKLYDAIVSGDKVYMERLKSTYKTDSAYQSAVRKALRENDSRIHAAAQAKYEGNTEEYKRIFREIQKEGKFSFNDIMSAINSEESAIHNNVEPDKVTSQYSASGFVEAVAMGNASEAQAMRGDIIATYVANGKTEQEAEEAFESAVASGIRDAYSTGLLDKAGAENMLAEYAGKDEDEAASKVGYWAFCEEHKAFKDVFSESNVAKYHEFAEPAGISVEVYAQYITGTKGLETKYDEWGDVEKSVRDQTLEFIDSLPLTWQQKDALYLAAGYAESKIWDVPW